VWARFGMVWARSMDDGGEVRDGVAEVDG
jgi:hypothetical protein